MDMNHLIGQRFNLISKSDIRYVGTLHEINPEASTIALENVVSHGTEGRRGNPAEEIAPSASVYEYIVFRGSDVKDISVAEEQKETKVPEPPQVPNDPAILGSGSRPGPSQGTPRGQPAQPPPQSQPQPQPQQQPQPPRQPPPGYPQQPPQQPPFQGYPPYGQRFGPPGYPPGPGFPNMPYGAPPGWYPPPGQGFPQPPGQFPPQMPIGPPGSQGHRPGPPGVPQPPVHAPKPTSELPVGEKTASKPASATTTPAPGTVGQQNVPTPPVEPKQTSPEGKAQAPDAAAVQNGVSKAAPSAPVPGPSGQPESSKGQPTGGKSDRVVPAVPITSAPPKPAVPLPASGNAAPQASTQNGPAANVAMHDATRAATAAVAAAMAKLPQPSQQKKQQQFDSAVDNLTTKVNEMRPYESGRGNRGGYPNQRGTRGGSRGGNYQSQTKKIEVPTTDYDFATANAKFNKQDLVKEAIASGSPMGETDENPLEVQEDPISHTNGTAAGQSQTGPVYNKSSSFFDNISSESRDREEGSAGRVSGREWRGEEEKKNMETFGQGSVDGSYRGGYRGRGRGRGYGGGRGRGRGYGGRGRGGARGRGAPQSTGVPT